MAVATLSMVMGGCAVSASAVRQRHSADFGCSAESVQVTPVSEDAYRKTFRADGCGKTATYVCADGFCIHPRDAGATPATQAAPAVAATPASKPEQEPLATAK